MDTTLRFSDIPSGWAICFQADCPLAANCLRRHAATLAPADLEKHTCVLPGARTDADTCKCFIENHPMRLAHGMKNLLPRMSYEEGIALRKQLLKM